MPLIHLTSSKMFVFQPHNFGSFRSLLPTTLPKVLSPELVFHSPFGLTQTPFWNQEITSSTPVLIIQMRYATSPKHVADFQGQRELHHLCLQQDC